MYVNIKNKAHSIMQSYWIWTETRNAWRKNTQEPLNEPVQIQLEDGHHSAITKSDVKLIKKNI